MLRYCIYIPLFRYFFPLFCIKNSSGAKSRFNAKNSKKWRKGSIWRKELGFGAKTPDLAQVAQKSNVAQKNLIWRKELGFGAKNWALAQKT